MSFFRDFAKNFSEGLKEVNSDHGRGAGSSLDDKSFAYFNRSSTTDGSATFAEKLSVEGQRKAASQSRYALKADDLPFVLPPGLKMAPWPTGPTPWSKLMSCSLPDLVSKTSASPERVPSVPQGLIRRTMLHEPELYTEQFRLHRDHARNVVLVLWLDADMPSSIRTSSSLNKDARVIGFLQTKASAARPKPPAEPDSSRSTEFRVSPPANAAYGKVAEKRVAEPGAAKTARFSTRTTTPRESDAIKTSRRLSPPPFPDRMASPGGGAGRRRGDGGNTEDTAGPFQKRYSIRGITPVALEAPTTAGASVDDQQSQRRPIQPLSPVPPSMRKPPEISDAGTARPGPSSAGFSLRGSEAERPAERAPSPLSTTGTEDVTDKFYNTPHAVQEMRNLASLDTRERQQLLRQFYSCGEQLSEKGSYSEASICYRRCIEIDDWLNASDKISEVKRAKAGFGNALMHLGEVKESADVLSTLLRDCESNGDDEYRVVLIKSMLAIALYNLGQPQKAIVLLEQNLRFEERMYALHPKDVVSTLLDTRHTLARLLYKKGEFVKACRMEASTVDQLANTLSADHPDVLTAQKRLGIDMYNSKRWTLGYKVLRQYQDTLVRLSQINPSRREWAVNELQSAELKDLIEGCDKQTTDPNTHAVAPNGYFRRASDADWEATSYGTKIYSSTADDSSTIPASQRTAEEVVPRSSSPRGRSGLLGPTNQVHDVHTSYTSANKGLTKRDASAPSGGRSSDNPPATLDVPGRPSRARASSDTRVEGPITDQKTHGALYDTSEQSSSDRWFVWLKRSHALLDFNMKKQERVKIAILDTGIDGSHPVFAEDKRIKGYKSWIEPIAERKPKASGFQEAVLKELCLDKNGHGTHAAALLLRVDPLASLYVARVVEGNDPRPEHVAEAITFAADEWGVDIISLSLGFHKHHDGIDYAVRQATEKGVLVFAAASNEGINNNAVNGIAYPARHENTICVNSADFYGTTSGFNPPPNGAKDYFAILGENVLSAWTSQGPANEPADTTTTTGAPMRRSSGTSVATPIAAATASIFLEFMRARALATPEAQRLSRGAALLKRTNGMRIVLRSIAKRKGHVGMYQFIAPWFLLNEQEYDPEVVAQVLILRALSQEFDLGPE